MTGVLAATWRWQRVGGSERLHLCPPFPGRWSRTACNRLPLQDAVLETPAGLVDQVPKCQACAVAGAKGGPA